MKLDEQSAKIHRVMLCDSVTAYHITGASKAAIYQHRSFSGKDPKLQQSHPFLGPQNRGDIRNVRAFVPAGPSPNLVLQ